VALLIKDEPPSKSGARCCDEKKTVSLIGVFQNVMVILMARAWTDALYEIAFPLAIDQPLHSGGSCDYHSKYLGSILVLGAIATSLVASCFSKGAIGTMVPAVVGMCMSSTLTPAVLACRKAEIAVASHTGVHHPPQLDLLGVALGYLICSILVFVLLTEINTRCFSKGGFFFSLIHLASSFLSISAAAIFNATSKEYLAFFSHAYLVAYVTGAVDIVRLPSPGLLQSMWAMAAFLWLPRALAAITGPLTARPYLLDFAIKLFAFYVAFQILNAALTLVAELSHSTILVSDKGAPLWQKAALAFSMAFFAIARAVWPTSAEDAAVQPKKKGLAAIAKEGINSKEAIEEVREAFVDHTVGMSLGWSFHPFVKALFLLGAARFSDQPQLEATAMMGYSLGMTIIAGSVYTWLYLLKSEKMGAAEGAADAGFTADDGGGDGDGGGDDGGGGGD